MNAEIVAVGTELLLGQIPNTNAQRISESLAGIGVDVYFHVTAGDNLERMAATFRQAIDRSDTVIITGGLGPTPDDITREALAEVARVRLVRDVELERKIRGIFERLGRKMPATNLRQADLPEGATPIGPEGTAPGLKMEIGGSLVFALPGVPWEMEAMLTKTVLPDLKARGGEAATVSREILVVGLGESHTHESIADIVDAQTNPTIAYLAGGGRVRLRLTAKAATESEALALIDPVEGVIRERLGAAPVEGHDASLAAAVGRLCLEKELTIGVCESLTGGLIASQLTEAPGSSDYFLGALVCYTNEAKSNVAGVDESILSGPGAVSAECAAALAEGAVKRFGADLGLSATGVAGPTEQEGKPVGTIFVGAFLEGRTETRHVQGYGDRTNVKGIAATAALDLGRRLIKSFT